MSAPIPTHAKHICLAGVLDYVGAWDGMVSVSRPKAVRMLRQEVRDGLNKSKEV